MATKLEIRRITPDGTEGHQVACDPEGNMVQNLRTLHLVFSHRDESGDHEVVFETPATVAGYPVEDHTLVLPAAPAGGSSAAIVGGFPVAAFGSTLRFTADSSDVKVEAYAVW